MKNMNVYEAGKERINTRFEKELEERTKIITYTEMIGYGDRIYEVSHSYTPEVDEEEVWDELLKRADEGLFTEEETYFAICELHTDQEANEWYAA